jgi:hypothetical protein
MEPSLMASKLRSRKFWFGLGGAVTPILAALFSDSVELGEALKLSTGAVMVYLAAQAGVDLAEKRAAKPTLAPGYHTVRIDNPEVIAAIDNQDAPQGAD